MAISAADRRGLESLELRIKTILPEEYQDCYEEVEPVSMGSAGLKFGRDGRVAWSDMWNTFCDLAMAGGPPHKGKLLEAGLRGEVEAQPERYAQVVDEICRGIEMVTGLRGAASATPGWIRVECGSAGMAGWLARAIVMENVSARCEDQVLEVPAGPGYRLEKEIKNVVTVMAKTCHYWLDHMWEAHQRVIGELFASMEGEWPPVQPALRGYGLEPGRQDVLREKMAGEISEATGLMPSEAQSEGWLGVECPSVRAAIWMMRAMVASNVFARREEQVLFVPVNAVDDPEGGIVVGVVLRMFSFAKARGVI